MKNILLFAIPFSILVAVVMNFSRDEKKEYVDKKNKVHSVLGKSVKHEKESWDKLFKQKKYVYGKEPIEFLRSNVGMFKKGQTLVVPMEEGRNAIYLSLMDHSVTGIDFSKVALAKAQNLARENKTRVKGINADLNLYKFEEKKYDNILLINFYRPGIIKKIKKSVKVGGLILAELSTKKTMKKNPKVKHRGDYLMSEGQLKKEFSDFEILKYQESETDTRAYADIIARRVN